MLEVLGLTKNYSVGSVNWTFFLTLTFTALACSWYSTKIYGRTGKIWSFLKILFSRKYWGCVFSADRNHDAIRYPAAVGLVLSGVDIRITGWVPWKGMGVAVDRGEPLAYDLSEWWVGLSWIWSEVGLWVAIAGFAALCFVTLDRKFGKFKYIVVIVGTFLCIIAGAAITKYISYNLENIFAWSPIYQTSK